MLWVKAFSECPETKTVFLVTESNSNNIHQALTDGKVWDDENQWGTACTSGAHARCIPEGIFVLQPSRVLAQGLISLCKVPRAALESWKALLSTTI